MRIEILSNEDMKKIHEASLAILEVTGIRIDHKETLEKLADAGAMIDIKKILFDFRRIWSSVVWRRSPERYVWREEIQNMITS